MFSRIHLVMQPNATYESHGNIKPYNKAQHRHDSSLNLIINFLYKYIKHYLV